MMHLKQKNGFTLVELIVSVGITAILMVGISTFFSSTFRNMFLAREKVTNSQGQFTVSTILEGKFVNTQSLQAISPGGTYAVIRNDMNTGELPFTFIGSDAGTQPQGHMVFKDFFVFNGRHGAEDSFSDTPVRNPGGIEPVSDTYYVTAPLENKIYKCPSMDSCPPQDILNIPDLNQPMDVTGNGFDTLYVTDAGNGRVLMITDLEARNPNVTVLASNLNYPTGLAYYNSGAVEFLFVSDTYNHLVKKITLTPPYIIETVVGAGDDEVCDPSDGREHSALFCKLHFPTGLLVSDDPALYISDTGNGRVLKVTDPNPDLTDYELPLSLNGVSQVKKVDFELPAGSTVAVVLEGASGNDLHPVKLSFAGPTITASLTGQTTGNVIVPICSGLPPTCTDYFRGFYVNDENNIFETDDTLDIAGGPYTVTGVSDEGGGSWKVSVTPLNTTINPPVGTDVRVTNTFSGNHSFHLNLSDVIFSETFNKILIKAYDEGDSLINESSDLVTVRAGDDVLGTPEDVIELATSGLDFPTGIGWSGGIPVVSDSPEFSILFPDYDYVSGFMTDNFLFSEPNGGDLLELDFSASLGQDAEGNEIWQDYSLNSDVNP